MLSVSNVLLILQALREELDRGRENAERDKEVSRQLGHIVLPEYCSLWVLLKSKISLKASQHDDIGLCDSLGGYFLHDRKLL